MQDLHTSNREQSGFTLLELTVVIVVISILGFFALDRLFILQAKAEQVAAEQVIGVLQSAANLTLAKYVISSDARAMRALEQSNPMELLVEKPKNYAGERTSPGVSPELDGKWFWDKSSRTLVYQVQNIDYFQSSVPGLARVRFKLRIVYTDNNHNDRFDLGVDNLAGLVLRPLEPYRWLAEAKAP